MRVKNIRQFRTFFKENVRKQFSPNRDEHFLGAEEKFNDESKFGWFDIYHGRKSIPNFLKGFLEMAGDGQAIYEFLQNAVDARSSHFYMKWQNDQQSDDDYLMICNNGSFFDVQSIISILNVGESTKFEEESTIGQYGIGFKLAHKLVGSSNGLEELMNQYQGPILFSWSKLEQLEAFVSSSEIEPAEFGIHKKGNSWISDDMNPWLFKMLITCFPVLPENQLQSDTVIDLKGRLADNLFSRNELVRFQSWVHKVIPLLRSKNYTQGSIVFIRLGAGKRSVFSTKELQSGIHFSLGILDELKQGSNFLSEIQFNSEESIHKPDLKYEKFTINKDIEHGLPRDKVKNDIEFIFGFRPYTQINKYFESKPNFFLFFPLSAEVHNLNFILHCNHFDKSSSRTHLQHNPDQTGLNELLFKILIIEIDKRFRYYSENKNGKLLDFYAAILSSDKSLNQERKWVYDCFIKPLNGLLEKYIPYKSEDFYEIKKAGNTIKVLDTEVDIDFEQCGIYGLKWFFYDDKALVKKAKKKLKLEVFSIADIFAAKDSYKQINLWIGADSEKAKIIAKETNDYLISGTHKFNSIQKENFLQTKFIEFTDAKFYSFKELNDLASVDRLIIYGDLKTISHSLSKLEVVTSIIDFDMYPNIEKLNYLGNDFQFRNKTSAIHIINNNCKHDLLEQISLVEKLKIFNLLVDRLSDQKISRGGEIKLFRNTYGVFVPLNNILSESIENPLLSSFKINKLDNNPTLQRFTCNNSKDIYRDIIYNHWSDILRKAISYEEKKFFFEDLKTYIQNDDKKLLNDHNLLIFKNQIYKISENEMIFFHKSLSTISSSFFLRIQSLLKEKLSIVLPDQHQMEYLEDRPWGFISDNLDITGHDFTEEEMRLLIEIDKFCKLNLFTNKLINEKESLLYEICDSEGKIKQYAIENQTIRSFVKRNLSNCIKLLPLSLVSNEILNVPSISRFVKDLASIINKDSNQSIYKAFIQIVEILSADDQKSLFNEIEQLYFFKDDDLEFNKPGLKFIKTLIEENVDLELISSKIVVCGFGAHIYLKHVTEILDNVKIKIKENISVNVSKSKILSEAGKDQLNNLNDLLIELVSEDIISESNLRKLLKLDEQIKPTEVVDNFFEVLADNDNIISNTDQLLFLLANIHNTDNEISDYHLYNINRSITDLTGIHFIASESVVTIVSRDYILDERYKDLHSRLFPYESQINFKLSEDERDKSVEIFFINEMTHTTPLSGNMLISELSCSDLMNVIQVLYINGIEDNWKWDFDSIFNKLGLTPKEYSKSPRFENEKIPVDLKEYSDDLLQLIGVGHYSKSISVLHNYLSGDSNQKFYSDKIHDLPVNLLTNVFRGISRRKDLIQFEINSDRFELLMNAYKSLLNRGVLLSDIQTIPSHHSKEQIVIRAFTNTQFRLSEEDWHLINKVYGEPNIFSELHIIPFALSSKYPILGNRIKDLQISLEIVNEEILELEDDRYLEWKEINVDLRIFKIEGRPLLEFVYQHTNSHYYKEKLLVGDFYIEDQQDYSYNLYFDLNVVTPSLILENIGNHDISYALEEYLVVHKDQMASFAEYILNPDKSGLSDEEHEGLLRIRREKERKEERKKLVDSLETTDKYSFKWFVDYIHTLISYDTSDRSYKPQTIVFDKISTYLINDKVNRRYAHLKGPSKVISQYIQEFQDLRLLLKFKGEKSIDITLTSVSTKGQSLVVLYPPGFQDLIVKFPDLVQAKLNFTPIIDLRERLLTAFKRELSDIAWRRILNVLPNLHYIYGPPGTGKTYTLCSLLKEKIQLKPSTKALMVGPTNKAADVLIKRIYSDFDVKGVLRISNVTDPELNEINEEIYKLDVNESDLINNLVATTIHRLPYFSVDDIPLYALEDHWDYLIIDEASMVSVEYIVFAILAVKKYSPECKIFVAGDPKQIPPVVDVSDKELEQLQIEELNIYRMMNISEINTAKQNIREIDKIDILTNQYRSIEPIGNLYSQYGYQGILTTDRLDDEGIGLPDKHKLLNAPITFIDIPLDKGETVVQVEKLNNSPYHLYTALLVVEILRDLGKHIEYDLSVGIVTPYKSQAVIVERLVTSADLSRKLDVTCDTVHGFQGDEKKLIIFIVNPNNYRYTGHEKALLSKHYIYNVAISRAEDKLWVLHPESDLENRNNHVDSLFNIEFARANGIKYVDSKDIEKILFNKEDYIRTNSYITSHDSVNVYGLVDMGYFIKVSGNAVDIQIQGGTSLLENENKLIKVFK